VATLTALTATAAQSPQDFGLFGSLPGMAQGSAAERNSYLPGNAPQQSEGAGPANSVLAAETPPPGMSPVVSWDTLDANDDKAGQSAEDTPKTGTPGNAPQDNTARTSTTAPNGTPGTAPGGTPATGTGGTPTGTPSTAPDSGTNSGTGTPAPAHPGTPVPTQPSQPSPTPVPSTPVPDPIVTPEPTSEPEPPPAEPAPAPEPTPSETAAVEAPPADAPASPAPTGAEQPTAWAAKATPSVPA
jgi:molecular chaperone DnaK